MNARGHASLVIYSYLPTKDLLRNISYLCWLERIKLKNSGIIEGNRGIRFIIDRNMLYKKNMDNAVRSLKMYVLDVVPQFSIVAGDSLRKSETNTKNAALLVNELLTIATPKRNPKFLDRKISLILNKPDCRIPFKIDDFFRRVNEK